MIQKAEDFTIPVTFWDTIAVTKTPETRFTKITRKCKKPKSKLHTRKFSPAEEKVVLKLESKPTITNTKILTLANEVMGQ